MIYVAKSYQSLPILGEPFEQSGRMYVKVQMKSGKEKTVRSYTEKEYNKMYPATTEATGSRAKKDDPYYKPQKLVLGFDKGYVWIFRGTIEANEEWFNLSPCRYCRFWGWYLPSTREMPTNIPANLEPVKLPWDPMGDEEDWLVKDEQAIKRHVNSILYPPDNTPYPAAVGDRVEITIEVTEVHDAETAYGTSRNHIFKDQNGILYSWKTTAKKWEVGDEKTIRGSVKILSNYKGKHLTVLQRCMEV